MQRSAASRRGIAALTIAGLSAALSLVPLTAAQAAPSTQACAQRNNNSVAKLLECVKTGGVFEHLDRFQAIADANGGNRAAGLPGYEASADYVAERLRAAGWTVTFDEFDYEYIGPSTLRQVSPASADYATGAFTNSASGSLEGTVIPVDVVLAQPAPSTSACEPADFDGLDFSGDADIALVQRGTCNFSVKVENAQNAGAEAVVLFNQGDSEERSGLIVGTLDPFQASVPVVGASFADGSALAAEGSTAFIDVPEPESRPQRNVIAELPGKNSSNVVMAGAHLDSVADGPGINDNGSGSAALLEVAENLGKLKPQNTLRFAWWGAEEDGLLGSQAYVDGLPQAERDKLALYLNFDMVASPNYIHMVYDSDESGYPAPVPVPEGSIAIEDLFESYYTSLRIPYDDAEYSGRSDYDAFISIGVASGGLFTGAEELKTEQQAAIWGGTAGEQLDPCYHLACDTRSNIDSKALLVNVGAIATAVLTYAYSTESVNGVKGTNLTLGSFLPAPAGPQGTVGGSGGLSHDHGVRETS